MSRYRGYDFGLVRLLLEVITWGICMSNDFLSNRLQIARIRILIQFSLTSRDYKLSRKSQMDQQSMWQRIYIAWLSPSNAWHDNLSYPGLLWYKITIRSWIVCDMDWTVSTSKNNRTLISILNKTFEFKLR